MTQSNELAFPYPGRFPIEGGVSKRELFAAIALHGLLAYPGDQTTQPELYAGAAVRCADALLKELAK